jgi:hypothetical protein
MNCFRWCGGLGSAHNTSGLEKTSGLAAAPVRVGEWPAKRPLQKFQPFVAQNE